jgi:hypothetical protein
MNLRRISAVDHYPFDLRAAHPNVAERAVIERMKLAYRRDACASDGVGAPPVVGLDNDRLGKEADDGRSAAGSGLKRAQAGAAEVVGRLGARRLGVADHELHHPLPLVRAQTPVVNPIVETYRAFGCLRFKIRRRSPICRGIAVTLHGPASDGKWASDVDHSNE